MYGGGGAFGWWRIGEGGETRGRRSRRILQFDFPFRVARDVGEVALAIAAAAAIALDANLLQLLNSWYG